jgi:uncharacterized protein (TIGR02266 family)
MQKPITPVNASRCFHAALNFMLKERRRYFRQPVKMQVKIADEGKTISATSTNISEGGMALISKEPLPKGATLRLNFCLPHSDTRIEVDAEVAWADLKGLAGLRFQNVSKQTQQHLDSWLNARIEEEFPGTRDRLSTGQAPIPTGFQPPPDRES